MPHTYLTLCRSLAASIPFLLLQQQVFSQTDGSNPLFRDLFTADPAPLVVGETLYLYTGHDEAKGKEMFTMKDWLCYSTTDMKTWKAHGPVMKATDFKWATGDAWAAQTIQKDGKFYFYATVQHDKTHNGKAIGVAVSESPTGPFVDARGTALITEGSTPSRNGWDDIDPTVLIDDDGTGWLAWGNPNCYLARLKPNMTEIDGDIQRIFVPNYTEGPWLSKRNGLYYLTYAAFAHQGFSEKICYATATSLGGPWTYRGILSGEAKNSYTIHPGIIDFKGQSYLFYHHADLTLPDGQKGGLGRRAVCVEYLHYNPDGTIQPIQHTKEGVSVPPRLNKVPIQPSNNGVSDYGIVVQQDAGPGARNWTGNPAMATVAAPLHDAVIPNGFIQDTTSLGQTFCVEQETQIGSITLYAGDGMGTKENQLITVSLYDLGNINNTNPGEYNPTENLLGSGKGFKIAYRVQAPGLLQFDLKDQIVLQAGHRYVLELQGERNSAAMYWKRTQNDIYNSGAAYKNRKLISERNVTSDFAFAIHQAK